MSEADGSGVDVTQTSQRDDITWFMDNDDLVFRDAGKDRPYILVFANEKGGTGKSTLSFHAIVALQALGYAVASIDADCRQGTLSRYLENRFAAGSGAAAVDLASLRHVRLTQYAGARDDDSGGDQASLIEAREALQDFADAEFVVIDTPGTANALAGFSIANADTLVSPVNDSYVDIDNLAALDMTRREVTGPGHFTRLVWEQNNRRIAAGLPPTDWIVLRNRLTHIDSRNKRDIADLMSKLADRIGFRVAPGVGERVIYRELFHKGLTVLDSDAETSSESAARGEMTALLGAIGLSVGTATHA